MKLQITAESAALVAANTHSDDAELAPLSVAGALLSFDFSACDEATDAINTIRTMSDRLGQLIADADDDAQISQLSALKRQVVGIERDVLREYQYKTRASAESEATTPEQESQLQGEQHTDISDSSSSNGASLAEKEVSDGTQKEQGKQRSGGGRRGRQQR
jgi:hypothetical protein